MNQDRLVMQKKRALWYTATTGKGQEPEIDALLLPVHLSDAKPHDLLNIHPYSQGDYLYIIWQYFAKIYRQEAIQQLALVFIEELRKMMETITIMKRYFPIKRTTKEKEYGKSGIIHTQNSKPASSMLIRETEKDIARYKKWLEENTNGNCLDITYKGFEYIKRAKQPVVVRNQEIRSFSPFNDELSALRTFLPWQVITLLCILLVVSGGFVFMTAVTFLIVSLVLASIPIFYQLTLFVLSLSNLLCPAEIKINDEIVHALAGAPWPTYTILCPLYQEAAVAHQLVHGLRKLDYPTDKLQILLLLEEYDHETRAALEEIVLPTYFSLILLPPGEPRTKARSCNYGLLKATGEYIVIYDAEDMPDPLQLKKVVLAFAHCASDVTCIQAKLNFYNSHQNLLTHWFTLEYSVRYGLTLPALQKANLTIPLGGTSNHFRTTILRQLGAWDMYNVTEDCDLGIRLAHSRFKTAIVDSTTYEEANSQLNNWIRQRSRWLKGFMQTYLVYMRKPWQYVRKRRWREFLSLQFLLLINVLASIANPFLWLLLLFSLLFNMTMKYQYYDIFMLTSIMSAISIIVSNITSISLAILGCVKSGQYDLLKWIFLHPLYLFLIGWAGLIASYQLIFKPHYWGKTNHGMVLYREHEKS